MGIAFKKYAYSQASWKTPLNVFVLLGLMQFWEICVTPFQWCVLPFTKRRKKWTAAVDRGSLFSEFGPVLDQLDGHDCLRNPWRGTNDYDVFEPNKNTNTISLYIKHAKTHLIGALCLKLWNPIIELDWRFIKSCGRKSVKKSASTIAIQSLDEGAFFHRFAVTFLEDL